MTLNPDMHRFVERRAYCPIEFFRMHRHTREFMGCEKLVQFNKKMKTTEEEEDEKIELAFEELQK